MGYGKENGPAKDGLRVDVDALEAIKHAKEWPKPEGPPRMRGPTPRDDSHLTVFVQPDAHCPYHDPRALELILRVLEHVKPEVAVVLGDHFDFYAISDHRKDPKRRLDLEAEIASGDAVLRDYERLGVFKRKIFCQGNHEWRLDRYIADKAQDVYRALAPAGLLSTRSLPEALDFKARGWEWVPYMDYGRIGDFYFTHDVHKAGKAAHEAAQSDFGKSTAIGHVHRMRMMTRGDVMGNFHTGAAFGWLGDWRQIDYKHRMQVKAEWPLGFGIVYIEKATGAVQMQPILIASAEKRRYRCVVEGKSFFA